MILTQLVGRAMPEDIDYRCKIGMIKETTRRHYQLMIEPFVARFGAMRMMSVTPAEVRNFVHDDVVTAGIKTAAHRFIILKSIYERQVKSGELSTNPFVACEAPRPPVRKRPAVLTAKQCGDLYIGSYAHDVGAAIRIGLASGARRGEIHALTWNDFTGTGINIDKTSVLINSTTCIQSPKSPAANRFISLPPNLCEELEFDRREPCNKMVPTHLGVASMASTVHAAMQALGIPKSFTMHDLRHAHATHLLASQIPLATVSARLGHAKVTTTLNYYAHALEADEGKINEVISRLVDGVSERRIEPHHSSQ